jgi:hypothetical protein
MRKSILTARQEWAPAYARVTKVRGGVNKLRSEAFATELHGKEGNKGIFTAKTQRAQSKARVDPRIRKGD